MLQKTVAECTWLISPEYVANKQYTKKKIKKNLYIVDILPFPIHVHFPSVSLKVKVNKSYKKANKGGSFET
jgi:hypothetical protein